MVMAARVLDEYGGGAHNVPCVRKAVYGKTAGSDMEARSGYNSRSDGISERTGKPFAFAGRGDLLHHEILYPDGALLFASTQDMWCAVNAAEKHPRAQFAYEVVLPLSADLSPRRNLAMVREFARWYRVRHGVPVQIDLHSGAMEDADMDRLLDQPGSSNAAPSQLHANPHAHLLMPTRVLGPDGFGAKTRALNPPFYAGRVMEEEYLRHAWADLQQRHCAEHGVPFRVNPTGFVPQPRLGPPAGWKGRPDAFATMDLVRRANAEAACDPARLLDKLTQNNASFTDVGLDALLRKHLTGQPDAAQRMAVARADVFAHPDLLVLTDKASGDWSGRYSTRTVVEQEARGLAEAAALAQIGTREAGTSRAGGASPAVIRATLARDPQLALEPDQRAAFDYTVAPGLLKVVKGRAGTGKSRTLAAIRKAFEDADPAGRPRARVIGLSHMHIVKEDMKADGFREAYTVEHMLKQLARTNGGCWRDVAMVAVDEAAMLSTTQLAGTPARGDMPERTGLVEWARRTGTKLVLVGDDRQLPSIDRGGLFTEIAAHLDDFGEAHRARELTIVHRQRQTWQREVAQDLARYDFVIAVDRLDEDRTTPAGVTQPGRIGWHASNAGAINALIDAWRRDAALVQDGGPDPMDRQFVFAFTHAEVDELNRRLRAVRRASGRMADESSDVLLDVCYRETAQGEERELRRAVPFAPGDRIQFTATSEERGIFNGNLATIVDIRRLPDTPDQRGVPRCEMVASVDTAAGGKRVVRWTTDSFDGIRHGYAGTGWKGQGKTIDRTYHLFGPNWDAAMTYMLLTRQREELRLFVASPSGKRDRGWLVRQMARRRITSAAISWNATPLQTPAGPSAAAHDAILPAARVTGHDGSDIGDGRETFRRKVRQRRQFDCEQAARRHVADWDRHLTALQHALARHADQATLRHLADDLAATARAITGTPTLAQTLRNQPQAFGLAERPELHILLHTQDTDQALRQLTDTLRKQQREHRDKHERPRGLGA